MSIKLSIRDNAFGHSPISNSPTPAFIDPSTVPIEWDRESPVTKDTIYTEGDILTAPEGARIWLIEPNDKLYDWVIDNQGRFSEVWTASRRVLEHVAHARFLTNAGCWIKPEDRKIWPKTRGISQIASNKRGAGGYNLRHLAARTFPQIDTYVSEYLPITPTWSNKIHALRDYRFHLVIENCRRDYFFTEKLIDCFLTGTIPIYWGCPSIHERFNIAGMITLPGSDPIESLGMCGVFSGEADLLYNHMKVAIEENFRLAQRYVLTEDYIAKNLLPT